MSLLLNHLTYCKMNTKKTLLSSEVTSIYPNLNLYLWKILIEVSSVSLAQSIASPLYNPYVVSSNLLAACLHLKLRHIQPFCIALLNHQPTKSFTFLIKSNHFYITSVTFCCPLVDIQFTTLVNHYSPPVLSPLLVLHISTTNQP